MQEVTPQFSASITRNIHSADADRRTHAVNGHVVESEDNFQRIIITFWAAAGNRRVQ